MALKVSPWGSSFAQLVKQWVDPYPVLDLKLGALSAASMGAKWALATVMDWANYLASQMLALVTGQLATPLAPPDVQWAVPMAAWSVVVRVAVRVASWAGG